MWPAGIEQTSARTPEPSTIRMGPSAISDARISRPKVRLSAAPFEGHPTGSTPDPATAVPREGLRRHRHTRRPPGNPGWRPRSVPATREHAPDPSATTAHGPRRACANRSPPRRSGGPDRPRCDGPIPARLGPDGVSRFPEAGPRPVQARWLPGPGSTARRRATPRPARPPADRHRSAESPLRDPKSARGDAEDAAATHCAPDTPRPAADRGAGPRSNHRGPWSKRLRPPDIGCGSSIRRPAPRGAAPATGAPAPSSRPEIRSR